MIVDVEKLSLVDKSLNIFVVLFKKHIANFLVLVDMMIHRLQLLIKHLNQLLINPHACLKGSINALYEIKGFTSEHLYHFLFKPLVTDWHLFYYITRHFLYSFCNLKKESVHSLQKFFTILS